MRVDATRKVTTKIYYNSRMLTRGTIAEVALPIFLYKGYIYFISFGYQTMHAPKVWYLRCLHKNKAECKRNRSFIF